MRVYAYDCVYLNANEENDDVKTKRVYMTCGQTYTIPYRGNRLPAVNRQSQQETKRMRRFNL